MIRAVAALAAAVMLAGAAPALGATPLTVTTSISPSPIFFGDTVTARVDVLGDRHQIDEATVAVDPAFGGWTQIAATRSASTGSGALFRRTWWYSIDCLTIQCVPKNQTVQAFRLPPVGVTALTRSGATVRVEKAWPPLGVAGRTPPPPNTAATPLFAVDRAVPPPTYRIDPGALALALDIGGALLLAAALGFILFEIASRRQPRRRDDAPVLARALALVRDAQTRAVEDRRRAVGLLARALPGDAERLSSDASRIAWSMPEPTPARLEELARDVEHGLEEQR